jgi:alanine racemase
MASSIAEAKTDWFEFYRDALRAEFLLRDGQTEKAAALLEGVITAGRQRTILQMSFGVLMRESLAEAYLRAGNKPKAIDTLRALIDSGMERIGSPVASVKALFHLAKLEFEESQTESARAHLKRFLDHWGQTNWDLAAVREAKDLMKTFESESR